MKRLQIIIVLAAILVLLKPVAACSYYEYPSVCDAYGSAEAVFVGTVQKVEEVKKLYAQEMFTVTEGEESKKIISYTDGNKYSIKVEKTYKGELPAEVVVAADTGTSCSRYFKAGQKLVFYANFNKTIGMWGVSYRTASFESAYNDLLFLNGLPENLNRTRVYGHLRSYEKTPDGQLIKWKNLPDVKVKIYSASRTFEMTTDERGFYEIYDLPVDSYTIIPEIPSGLKLWMPHFEGFGRVVTSMPTIENSQTLDLKYIKCAGLSFTFISNKTDETLK